MRIRSLAALLAAGSMSVVLAAPASARPLPDLAGPLCEIQMTIDGLTPPDGEPQPPTDCAW